jgi:hypothetical protein
MSEQGDLVSIDEFLAQRKGFLKGDIVVKASRAPSSWDAKTRSARFVISAEVEDRDRDVILQGGLSTDEFLKNPVAPFAHQSRTFPVGTWSDIEKVLSGRPKRTEGTLNLVPEGTDEVADRLAKHISVGTIRACSIGFVAKRVRRREVPEDKAGDPYFTPGYTIEAAELVECSPCVIPANPAAFAKSAAMGDALAREVIEEVLDTWTRHPETGLLVPRAEFEAAHKEATGERTSVLTTPQAPVAPVPASSPEPSLIRRAINAIIGKGDAPPDLDAVSVTAIARVMEADRARAERLKEISQAHQRFMRRHQAYERAAALKGRLDARGLT